MAKISKEKLEEVRQKMLSFRSEAEEANDPIFRIMKKCVGFKLGGRRQWDPNDLEYNDSHQRQSLSINRIRPTINFITGQQVKNPRDLTAVRNKSVTAVQTRLVTALMKQICDSSNARHKQTMAFDSGVTTRRGYIGIDTSYISDPRGDLQIRIWDPFSVLPDMSRKVYDPNDWHDGWRYVFIDEWEPKAKLEMQYPARKEDLARSSYGAKPSSAGWIEGLWQRITGPARSWLSRSDYNSNDIQERDFTDEAQTSKFDDHYRVSVCYWRQWRKGVFLRRLDVPGWELTLTDSRDISEAKKLAEESGSDRVQIIERDKTGAPLVVPILMRTRMVGDVILDHEEDPFDGIWQYPIVPFTPHFESGQETGVIDDLIDPQIMHNWSHSMAVSLIRKIANPGWRIKRALGAALQHLEEFGSSDGVILQEDNYGGKVEKLDPPDYQGISMLESISERSAIHIAESSNVRQERPEFDNKRLSGVAIARKQAASDQGNAVIAGNWDMTREILGSVLIEHILRRGTYTLEEIRQIVDDEDLLDPQLLEQATVKAIMAAGISPQPKPAPSREQLLALDPEDQERVIAQYKAYVTKYAQAVEQAKRIAPEMAIHMLWDELEQLQSRRAKFSITSSLSESTGTFREAKFAELLAMDELMMKKGHPGFSPKLIVKASDMSYKEEAMQDLQQTSAAGRVPVASQ